MWLFHVHCHHLTAPGWIDPSCFLCLLSSMAPQPSPLQPASLIQASVELCASPPSRNHLYLPARYAHCLSHESSHRRNSHVACQTLRLALYHTLLPKTALVILGTMSSLRMIRAVFHFPDNVQVCGFFCLFFWGGFCIKMKNVAKNTLSF